MPFIRINSSQPVDPGTIARIKGYGEILGYSDPRRIWVTVALGLQQDDVVLAEVFAKEEDFENGVFVKFCQRVANRLRLDLGKSAEVVTPADVPMRPVAWAPTEEGAEVYKD